MTEMRTLIVDDEPAARAGLRHLLSADPDIAVVGECRDGREAVAAMRDAGPELVFLDVQMPELDGFGVLRAVGEERLPVVVFVTAYDQYALRAFEVHAVDYLLKPFTDDRFREALRQAKLQVRRARLGELSRQVAALVADGAATGQAAGSPAAVRDRLVVKTGGGVTLVPMADIDWIDADGDYVRIHAGKAAHTVRETMHHLESELDPGRFVRIHRSTIVNLERIKELQPFYRGEFVAVLHDGTRLKLSRGCRDTLEARLGRRI
jgi:two-component system, LytTR family, response regulator